MQRFRLSVATEWVALAAALYFAAVCNARFWSTLLSAQRDAPGRALFAAATFVLLTALHLLLLLPFSSRYTLRPVLTLLLVANAAVIHFTGTYGVVIDTSMMRNVLQTDAHEAGELLGTGLLGALALYAALPVAALWLVRFEKRPPLRALGRKALVAAVALALVALPAGAYFGRYVSFFRAHREARYLVTPANYLVAATRAALGSRRAASAPRRPIGEDATRGAAAAVPRKPAVFVLALGETARAANFSLNGYARETNPRLREAGVVNFPSVTACGTATAESVPCLFSRLGRNAFDADAPREESLLDVLQRAGLRVAWFDNNTGCKGACDGVETRQLDRACGSADCFDELLVEEAARLLAAPQDGPPRDTVLVLHMKGSHGPAYFRRYPPEFERFVPACTSPDFADCTDEQIRNAYDNTILYTDHVLARLIELLGGMGERYDGALLYVSDHGESLGENGLYLHGLPWAVAPAFQKQVPMVFWMSPGFEATFGVERERLRALAGREHSHDHVFHSVLGLLDVRTALYDPALDLFAPARTTAIVPSPPT